LKSLLAKAPVVADWQRNYIRAQEKACC